ncbi:hypothetical protein BDW22DRAFT_717783 [Trametopsis cervina]|nr:hypothetical protein BDW22DRAFT_717783 [Trametopsis cervina]
MLSLITYPPLLYPPHSPHDNDDDDDDCHVVVLVSVFIPISPPSPSYPTSPALLPSVSRYCVCVYSWNRMLDGLIMMIVLFFLCVLVVCLRLLAGRAVLSADGASSRGYIVLQRHGYRIGETRQDGGVRIHEKERNIAILRREKRWEIHETRRRTKELKRKYVATVDIAHRAHQGR